MCAAAMRARHSHYDVAIGFGYGPVLPSRRNQGGRLDIYGRLNALALGMLYHTYSIDRILPTGGRTGGSDRPSEARLMARYAAVRFGIPDTAFWLEEEATNTIRNVVCCVNLLDRIAPRSRRLLFVALGYHLPRIRVICEMVGLTGTFMSAERVVSGRSSWHERLVRAVFDPQSPAYAQMLREEKAYRRALFDLPEYWLSPFQQLSDPDRLRRVLSVEHVQPFLAKHGVDVQGWPPERLRSWMRSVPRKWPFRLLH